MNFAVVYARVSSEDQAERKTIENQVDFAVKYCELHQIDILDWYKDDGVTGTIPLEERPEGRRLLADAQAGRFNLLLIYRLDRLGRSARVILNSVYQLEQYGVKIRSMTEPFDTADPSGRFLLTILAGVADLERETILSRMWYGANRAAREGKWLGGIVPYGYFVNKDGFLEISSEKLPGFDMSEADIVQLIYRLVGEQGFSTIQVADYLNALGVPPSYTKDGRKVLRGKRKEATAGIWRPGRIRNMIVNKTYMGIHEYGKRSNKDREVIVREVPAIVTRELWEKAQDTLRRNQIEAMRNAKRQYLLRGLIKCGTCGLNYRGTAYPGPGGKLKAYYVCNGKMSYRGPLLGKCQSKNIPAEWLENLVWEECVHFINHPGEALEKLAESMKDKMSERAALEDELEMVLKAAKNKEAETQSILDLYRKRVITAADVEKQLAKIADEKKALEERARELQEKIRSENELSRQFTSAEDLLCSLRAKLGKGDPTWEVKRQIIKMLVRKIVVNTLPSEGRALKSGQVIVEYAFSSGVIHTVRGCWPPQSTAGRDRCSWPAPGKW